MRADKLLSLAKAAAERHAAEGVEAQQAAEGIERQQAAPVADEASEATEKEEEGDMQWNIVRCVVLALEFLTARDLAHLAPTCCDIASSAELEQAWRNLRVDGLRRCFRGHKPSESEVEELMVRMDPGRTGLISRAAFCSAVQLWRIEHRLNADYDETMEILWDCFRGIIGDHVRTVDHVVSIISNYLLHGVCPPSRAGYAEMRRRAMHCGITTVDGGDELVPVEAWEEFNAPPRLYLVLMWIMEGHDAWYLPNLGRPGDGPELDPEALPWIVTGSVAYEP
eukprot:6558063-Prymnesium_polylepis.1